MDSKAIIYFDNAASSHPKPDSVYRAADRRLRQGGSAGRSAHQLAVSASRELFECRLKLADFFAFKNPERLIFTPGCTYSINMALRGFPFEPGDLVLVSALEHNALMRPLRLLEQTKGIEVQALPYAEAGIIDLDLLESTVRKRRPRLCAFLEASNVTGEILDIAAVSELCRRYELPLLIDAAQSAGVFHEKPNSNWISFWSAPAHKGLMGIPGLGLLYVHESMNLEPLVCGGTGSKSEKLEMPDFYPDRLEAGTMPVQAVAALAAGLDFLQETGLEKIKEHEAKLCKLFLNHLKTLAEKGLELELFAGVAEKRCSLLSFRVKGNDPAEMAELLDRDYGICVRAGLHCAALAHQSLGTQNTGLLRVSFGYFNTESELEILCDAISEITKMKTAKPRK